MKWCSLLAVAVLTMAEAKNKAPTADEAVIVVGGGLAGLSASIEIVKAGGKLILIDSEPQLGGNSAKASSGESFPLCSEAKLFRYQRLQHGDAGQAGHP